MDAVFKALADPTRRALLDRLNEMNGQTLRDLARDVEMSRQAVAKHLTLLEEAGLVISRRRGREKQHFLNPAPINDIAERWIHRFDRERVATLADLKRALEDRHMSRHEFVYITYIKTTPEQLWRALTEPAFIRRYFGDTGPESDWVVGSPVNWSSFPGDPPKDLGQVVLESDPPRRLSYTWHNYQPEMKPMFGWSDEQFAELVKEPLSKITFEIEPLEGAVKLTVTHDDFVEGSEMLKGVSQGWPAILSNLKTMLETDDAVLPAQ